MRRLVMIKTPSMQALKKIFLTGLFFLLISTPAWAVDYPKPAGYINDFAGVVSPPVRQQLVNIVTQFELASGNEIAVVTLPKLEGEPIENYSVGLFKAWGIGKKGNDNGILLLVALGDRATRIEVGYGLEPYINDALAGRIIRDTMIPHFRTGDFSGGILNGVVEITGIISAKTDIKFDPIAAGNVNPENIYRVKDGAKQKSPVEKIFKIIIIIFFIILFIKNPWAALFILSSFGRSGGGSFRGGFGGGFGGFGGGLSGGGGASGKW